MTETTRGPRRLLRRSTVVVVGALLFGAPFVVTAQRLEPEEWHSDDWAALMISVLLGLVFFVLAWELGKDAQSRARAVADGELITSVGALHASAARSATGSEKHALRLAADARAALQHHPYAGEKQQKSLVATIINSYSDLTFSTMCRADLLPRSYWLQLHRGATDLIEEANDIVRKSRTLDRHAEADLQSMAAHVRFALSIGEAVRAMESPDGLVIGAGGTPGFSHHQLLDHLARLYRTELTVVHDWRVLRRNAAKVDVAVRLEDINAAKAWYTPWYVNSDENGELRPVNVLNKDLDEPAKLDRFRPGAKLPPHPTPLRHGEVPVEMRSRGIARMADALGHHKHVTVCALVYQVSSPSGEQRIVLDGNHRIAAGLLLDAQRLRTDEPGSGGSVRVLTFLIREREPVTDAVIGGAIDAETGAQPFQRWRWHGFSPDVGLMHGQMPRMEN